MRRSSDQRGFTLLEMLVGVALSGLITAGAFALATAQIKSYGHVRDAADMRVVGRVTFQALARDLRNVGAGNRFYVGVDPTAFGGQVVLRDSRDGSLRGLPTLMVANQISTPGVMPGSDAIMLLRGTSATTRLADRVPASPSTATPYPVDQLSALEPCLGGGGGLVLLTDLGRATGESVAMLLPVDEGPSRVSGGLVFRSAHGIQPMRSTRATDGSVPSRGVGTGAVVQCAELVTYWVDAQANLREHLPTPNGAAVMAQGDFSAVPIDPQLDPILAGGVEDLQVSLRLSGAAPGGLSGAWALIPGVSLPEPSLVAEARVARVSVLVRGAHARRSAAGPRRIGALEDHDLSDVPVVGCSNPSACYDPTFARRVLVFHAEMRSMHISDLLADPTKSYMDSRSHP